MSGRRLLGSWMELAGGLAGLLGLPVLFGVLPGPGLQWKPLLPELLKLLHLEIDRSRF